MFSSRFIVCQFVLLSTAACCAPVAAQQDVPVRNSAQRDSDRAPLAPEETHIRAGIVILGKLCNILAQVEDARSAQAAVPMIMGLSNELHAWGQKVPSLPLRSSDVVEAYERQYLPIIEKLNGYLRAQGERLAASNYYDTQDLATALLTLYSSVQQ